MHYVGIVRVEDRKDICLTIPISMKGFLIKNALVDSGARVSFISELVVNKMGISIRRSSRAAVEDGGVVHCTCIVEDVVIEGFRIRDTHNKYHINLKESVPISPKLRQLGFIQTPDLIKKPKTLLQESFNYKMEDLKCVSPIVLVSNKNDIDFKPLNNEVIIYATQVNVENVVHQEGIHVDEAKIDVIQSRRGAKCEVDFCS